MSFSLADRLFAAHPFEEEVEVMGIKVRFRMTNPAEELDIVRSSQSGTLLEHAISRRVPTLARAILSIDGSLLSDADEIKQLLHSNPSWSLSQAVEAELQSPKYTDEVISALYQAYNEFRARYREHVENSKKNSTRTNPATAG